MAQIMLWEAIQRAHDEEMSRDPLVICMGEDIGVAGAPTRRPRVCSKNTARCG